jgi:hypothetical protein
MQWHHGGISSQRSPMRYSSKKKGLKPMIGDNRQLVTNEPVEFEK